MKSQVLYGIGNLKYTEVDAPSPKDGEALIKVNACGICGSDIPRIFKTGAHNMPLIPGHEFTGTVISCNEPTGTVLDGSKYASKNRPLWFGKRVGIFPLIPCKKCPQCKSLHYEMCENYNYLGSRCDGGFAEYATVPVWNLLPLPDEVTDEEAAMLEPMAVAIHAIRRTGLIDISKNHSQSTIVVCGLGTIGLLTALFLKDAGFTDVYCIGNKDIQKKMLLAMGYEESHFCDVRYSDPISFVMEKTGGRGTDYYFECIGRSESYEQAIKCTAPLGTVMLVGNPASDMELKKDAYWKILRNQLTLLGTWNSSYIGDCENKKDNIAAIAEGAANSNAAEGTEKSYKSQDSVDAGIDDWHYAINRLTAWKSDSDTANHFSPSQLITHRFSLEDMQVGLDIMRRKSEEYVKIMVE